MLEEITVQARNAVVELLELAKLERGDLFVVGCSSSEIVGGNIGKNSDIDAARAVFEGIYPVLCENGIFLAAQCCEHLNRSLIVEKEYALAHGLDIVCVRPMPKAGGSFATTVYDNLKEPVAVERVSASAGIDIGGTLIGMHLKNVAVPVRLSVKKIGEANIICARTRYKYVGGARACYPDNI